LVKGNEFEDDGTDRADVAEHILLLAERGHFKVFISSLRLAEVYKPQGYDPLNPTQNQRLLDYFEHEFFELVIVDRDIGLEANRIAAMHGLNPNDAIHTACALRAGCDVVLTWDKRFLAKTAPGIGIERPEKRGQQIMDLRAPGSEDEATPETERVDSEEAEALAVVSGAVSESAAAVEGAEGAEAPETK
jgi:predicted nucleic acid-binding protein